MFHYYISEKYMDMNGSALSSEIVFDYLIKCEIICVKQDTSEIRYFVCANHMQNMDEESVKLNFDCDLYY